MTVDRHGRYQVDAEDEHVASTDRYFSTRSQRRASAHGAQQAGVTFLDGNSITV